MPFDEEEPKDYIPKASLKKMNGKSMFDDKPKVPNQQEFQEKVQSSQHRQSDYKQRAADLFIQFNKSMSDKTLPQNQNVFFHETEREMLQKMIQLAMDINNDPAEENEGMGALTWITLLFKTCLSQRDRLNQIEYMIANLQKTAASLKEDISKALDTKKISE